MLYVCYGSQKSRITLYASDGTTPVSRITLQKEDREGLQLSFKPEGSALRLGSGSGWANTWTHHGHRASLSIKWSVGLESSIETWSGSAWGAPTAILTPIALSQIFNRAFQAPCLVEPHLDKAYSFSAQPDPGKAFVLCDRKGVVHTDLGLDLVAVTLDVVPDWPAL
jgi:hypothetical protein